MIDRTHIPVRTHRAKAPAVRQIGNWPDLRIIGNWPDPMYAKKRRETC